MTEEDPSNFPVVIRQEPLTYDDDTPINRLIRCPEDLPSGVSFTVIATRVYVDD